MNGFSLININVQEEYAFRLCCKYGYLDIAKWLIELSRSDGFSLIDIHNNLYDYDVNFHDENEEDFDEISGFQLSCTYGHLDFAQWLFELSKSCILLLLSTVFVLDRTCQIKTDRK